MSESWISAETEAKEEDFRGILSMHVAICKGIASQPGMALPDEYPSEQ